MPRFIGSDQEGVLTIARADLLQAVPWGEDAEPGSAVRGHHAWIQLDGLPADTVGTV